VSWPNSTPLEPLLDDDDDTTSDRIQTLNRCRNRYLFLKALKCVHNGTDFRLAAAVSPAFFYTFQNIDENVRHQLQKLRTHPWIPGSVAVRGFVYDVTSGRLREIKDA